MTTLDKMVTVVTRRLLSSLKEETDVLGADVAAHANVLTLGSGSTIGSVRAGAIIQVDYEQFYVLSNPSTIGSINVQPGYYGSTPAPHKAGAIVTVDPRFPKSDLIDAINEDLDDLSSPANGLFQMNTVTLTYNPAVMGYDLTGVSPSQILEVWEIRNQDYGPAQSWPLVPPHMYKLERNADPSKFPSGLSIKFYATLNPGRPIRVQYKAPYASVLANPGDDVFTVTGLHAQAHDIPPLGAAVRLVEYREVKRSFSEAQSEPRRSEEVPVGASLTALKGIEQRRQLRIEAERARLEKMFPRQLR